ncbi:MAG: C25 family cysteine peptidase [Candidatus Eisenbacteria bacterium]|nr:C25 family cysteine peptidase [Candidatus Eisenbacteria bacterium]
MRKGTLPLAMCFISVVLLLNVGAALGSTVSMKVELSGSELMFGKKLGYDTVTLTGSSPAVEPGKPELPQKSFLFAVPEGKKVTGVRVIPLSFKEFAGTFMIFPAQKEVPISEENPSMTPPDHEAYSSGRWMPEQLGRLGYQGFMRGQRIASVILNPVLYLPSQGKLKLITEMTVEFVLEGTDEEPVKVLRGNPDDKILLETLKKELQNPREVSFGAVPAEPVTRPLSRKMPFMPSFRPTTDGSPVYYVIITADSLASYFQTLADWYTKCGVPAVVRTIPWITSNYPNGVDLGETIRKFIKDAYSSWGTRWVLLAGDSNIIPARYANTTYYSGDEDIPTDMYYQCLDGNWDADGDAIFGEGYRGAGAPGDNADLYPEVWLGRAPVDTKSEASTFVTKLLMFMKTPASTYADKILFFSEVLFPQNFKIGDPVSFDGASITESHRAWIPGWMNIVRLYENYPAFPGSLPETRMAVIDSLESGFLMAQHVGHGYRNTMSVGVGELGNADVDALSNGSKLFALYGMNCTSAAFDFSSIGERFVLNPNGGSVSYIGSTRYDFPQTGWGYEDDYYEIVYVDSVLENGKALSLSKIDWIPYATGESAHRWTQLTLILLGDPMMRLWTRRPGELAVIHNSSMTVGDGQFAVWVTSGGTDVDSALVCLMKSGDDYQYGYTDASGIAIIPFNPDLAGTFYVTVTKRNCKPYEGTAEALAAPGKYLFQAGTVVNDDTNGLSNGNGDGLADSGERVEFLVNLKNSGGSSATGVSATLRTSDPYITLLDSTATYPDIDPGQAALPVDSLLFDIGNSCPDAYEASFMIYITSGVKNWTDRFVVKIHSHNMEHYVQALKDTISGHGNGNGKVEAGEWIELFVTLRNNGTGGGRTVTAKLTSADPAITITDSTSVYGDIASGAMSTGDRFMFISSDTLNHYFSFILQDAYGVKYTKRIDISKPSVPQSLWALGNTSSIDVLWNPNLESDLRGYITYRSSSGSGPFQRVSVFPSERISLYSDAGLLPFTRYFYKVSAVDSSGNESALSAAISASTNPPIQIGWPLEMGLQQGALYAETASSPVVGNLFFPTSDSLEVVVGADKVYAVRSDGEELIDGDNDTRTPGYFTNLGLRYHSSPALEDLDKDGRLEVICPSWENNKLYVWHANGQLAAGWPESTYSFAWGTPATADIDGDGYPEIVLVSSGGTTGGSEVLVFHGDGSELMDGDSNPATKGIFKKLNCWWNYGSPCLADIDLDGLPEIVFAATNGKVYVWNSNGTSVPGWPFATADTSRWISSGEAAIKGSPAVGNVDASPDGSLEIAVTSAYWVYLLRSNGTVMPGWPKYYNMNRNTRSPSPALADINNDGTLEVVVASTNGDMRVWTYQGAVLPGWSAVTYGNPSQGGTSECSPVVGDIDGDGKVEILLGSEDAKLYAWNDNGTELDGFPIHLDGEVRGTPVIWDIDSDGNVEIVVACWDKNIYVWKYPGQQPFSPSRFPWPMFMHDARRTGVHSNPVITAVENPKIDASVPEVMALLRNFPNPFNIGTEIVLKVGTLPAGSKNGGKVAVRVYDVSGRLVKTMVDGVVGPGVHTLYWDGKDRKGRNVPSGVYFVKAEGHGIATTQRMVVIR